MERKVIAANAYALILCIIQEMDRETALKKCGVELPFTQRGAMKATLIPKTEKDKIYNYYYKDDLSLNSIGEKYNVTPVTVKNFLVRMGIQIKSRGRYTKWVKMLAWRS